MREMVRHGVIQALLSGQMTNRAAAEALRLSLRQVQRLKNRVRDLGPEGVCHRNKYRRPAHAFGSEWRSQVIELATKHYADFNFSHLSESLKERQGISINRETLRQWLRPLGWGRKIRKLKTHRRRRPRSPQEGQMLFLDGSRHRWFGEENTTLILCGDDATGKPLYGLFQPQEDLEGCWRVCWEVFTHHGLPGSFYLDRASQFTTTRHGGVHVSQSDQQPTQFERAMTELAIGLIFAHSPQARGRGERLHGSFQDRLVAELRLQGITTAVGATHYLNTGFIPRYCQRFAVTPEIHTPAWRPPPHQVDLRNILCRRYTRTVKNDNTISIQGQIMQLLPLKNRLHLGRAKVQVHQWFDGSWHVFHDTYGEIPVTRLSQSQTPHTKTDTWEYASEAAGGQAGPGPSGFPLPGLGPSAPPSTGAHNFPPPAAQGNLFSNQR